MRDVTVKASSITTAALTALLASLDDYATVRLSLGTHTITGASPVVVGKPVRIIGGHREGSTLNVSSGPANLLQVEADDVQIEDLGVYSSTGTSHLFQPVSATAAWDRLYLNRVKFDGVTVRLTTKGRNQSNGTAASTGTNVGNNAKVMHGLFVNAVVNYTLELGGLENIEVGHCEFRDYGINLDSGDGIKVIAGTNRYNIHHSAFYDGTRDGIDAYDSHMGVMSDLVIKDCGGDGIDIKWQTVGDGTGSNRTDSVKIDKVIATGCGFQGIDADASRCTVTNSHAEDCANGFRASQSENGPPFVPTEGTRFIGCTSRGGTNGFVFSNGLGLAVIGCDSIDDTIGFSSSSAVNKLRSIGNSYKGSGTAYAHSATNLTTSGDVTL